GEGCAEDPLNVIGPGAQAARNEPPGLPCFATIYGAPIVSHSSPAEVTMDVLNPVRSVSNSWKPLARRPASLRGRRIGVLDNSKPNADALLGRLAERLVERHRAASIIRGRKPGSTPPRTTL